MIQVDTTATSGATRERILDAASSVFAEHGFAGARVDEIARRAGVNKAMLYYHVGDKRALYAAVLTRNLERVSAGLDEALDHGGTARERLDALVRVITRTIEANPEHARIVLGEVASGGANLPEEVLARMVGVFGRVRRLLEQGRQSGEFRQVEPLLAHLVIVGAVTFLNTVKPLRERVATLLPPEQVTPANVDLGAFLSDLLLHGIVAERKGNS